MQDIDAARSQALSLAAELFSHREDPMGAVTEAVLDTAGLFTGFLLARPASLHLIPAPFTFAQPDYPGPAVTTQTGDDGMSVSISDTQQVEYAVEAEDSRGFAVADSLTWSSDDNGAVVTVTPAADGMSCVFAAVAPGTATISVTDGTLSASDLITVTPGAVASLVLTPGAVTDEPAAPSA